MVQAVQVRKSLNDKITKYVLDWKANEITTLWSHEVFKLQRYQGVLSSSPPAPSVHETDMPNMPPSKFRKMSSEPRGPIVIDSQESNEDDANVGGDFGQETQPDSFNPTESQDFSGLLGGILHFYQ